MKILFSFVLVLIGITFISGWAAEKPATRPNILLMLADDWGPDHASILGDAAVKTPVFDTLAREGILFKNAYAAVPSCTGSRAAILSGQASHRLQGAINLSCVWKDIPPLYTDLLEKSGYHVGYMEKGWGPGETAEKRKNPAGASFKNFKQFMAARAAKQPFCFWFGSHDPHRGYLPGLTKKMNIDVKKISVPPFLPDNAVIRADMADYYAEVQKFDKECGEMIEYLKAQGLYENTLLVMTGDHGYPFPRGKGHLYDSGVKVPLAMQWPAKISGQRVLTDFVSLADCAPTFLEAAGLPVPAVMTAKSLMNIFSSKEQGRVDPARSMIFCERERHTWCHENGQSYPSRSVRTDDYLYIANMRPNLYPAGHPYLNRKGKELAVGHVDCDEGPSKSFIIKNKDNPDIKLFYERCFGKRPAEELYDVKADPFMLNNLVAQEKFATALQQMRGKLQNWMQQTLDPRARGETDIWDAPAEHRQPRADVQSPGFKSEQEKPASQKESAKALL